MEIGQPASVHSAADAVRDVVIERGIYVLSGRVFGENRTRGKRKMILDRRVLDHDNVPANLCTAVARADGCPA
eukprot:30173-Pelagococcus_subviridis.AAC.8